MITEERLAEIENTYNEPFGDSRMLLYATRTVVPELIAEVRRLNQRINLLQATIDILEHREMARPGKRL